MTVLLVGDVATTGKIITGVQNITPSSAVDELRKDPRITGEEEADRIRIVVAINDQKT